MRPILFCLLFSISTWTPARADEAAFRASIWAYISAHPPSFPPAMMDWRGEAVPSVTFSIDRDGRLLNATMAKGTGSEAVDQDMLNWFKRLQPFPHVPEDVPAPLAFSINLVLIPPSAASDVTIKWIADADVPAAEGAFREQVAYHLQNHQPPYFDDMKAGRGPRHATIAIGIDSDGKLTSFELIKASGSPGLDLATLRWLRGVPPYPQLPSVLKSPLKLKAEISFNPPRPGSDRLWGDQKMKRAISNVCRGC